MDIYCTTTLRIPAYHVPKFCRWNITRESLCIEITGKARRFTGRHIKGRILYRSQNRLFFRMATSYRLPRRVRRPTFDFSYWEPFIVVKNYVVLLFPGGLSDSSHHEPEGKHPSSPREASTDVDVFLRRKSMSSSMTLQRGRVTATVPKQLTTQLQNYPFPLLALMPTPLSQKRCAECLPQQSSPRPTCVSSGFCYRKKKKNKTKQKPTHCRCSREREFRESRPNSSLFTLPLRCTGVSSGMQLFFSCWLVLSLLTATYGCARCVI